MSTTSGSYCLKCGSPLSARALGGMCPICVGNQMMSGDPGTDGNSEPQQKGHQPRNAPTEFPPNQKIGAGSLIGPYRLIDQIGEGGFGVVYRAEQEVPVKRQVALKIVKLGMDTEQVIARFEAERQALALMNHSSIAKVFAAGATPSGRPYFVMELVEGLPITEYCDAHRLDTRQRLELFSKVCRAVQHAHQKSVIHRDLKPSNILVTDESKSGVAVPKIIDFGIAKATACDLTDKTVFTQFNQFLGTPAYMSPEQLDASGADIDTRSDVYSLGVLFYVLLTGRTPLDEQTLAKSGYEAVRRLVRENIPLRPSTRLDALATNELSELATQRRDDPAKLRKLIRGDLDRIAMKALEKDRSERYATANEFAEDIRRFFDNEPVTAASLDSFYLLKKFARRHKGTLVTAVAFASILICATVFSAWQAIKATAARNLADQKSRDEAKASQAEARQRVKAEQSLFQARYHGVEKLFQNDESAVGLATLARLLRDHPDSRLVANRLVSTLKRRSFAIPYFPPYIKEGITMARLSPDGTRIVSCSAEGEIQIWNTTGGEPASAPIQIGVAASKGFFSREGGLVATVSAENSIHLFDVYSGSLLAGPLVHGKHIFHIDFAPGGERFVTSNSDGTSEIWNGRTGATETKPLMETGWVQWAEFSPDGKQIATASRHDGTGTVTLWDATTGQLQWQHREESDVLFSARYNPDGTKLAVASLDGVVRVWSVGSGEQVLEPIRNPKGFGFIQVEWSRDGEELLTTSIDLKAAQVWDASNGRAVTMPLQSKDRVYLAGLSLDGDRVLTGSHDHTVRVWDALTGRQLIEPIRHGDKVESIDFMQDGEGALSVSSDHRTVLWDVRTRPQGDIIITNSGAYRTRFNPDGTQLLAASMNGLVGLRDSETGQWIWPATRIVDTNQPSRAARIFAAEFSPDGSRFITSSGAGSHVWDSETGQLQLKLEGHENTVRFGCFSPDGKLLATASADGTTRLWNARTGDSLHDPIQAGDEKSGWLNWILRVEFSPKSDRIVTASFSGYARVWSTLTGEPLTPPMQHEQTVVVARFSPDGTRILTGSTDGTARLWNARTGEPLGAPLAHDGEVNSARFSSDGSLVVTASSDGTARVWSVATGEPIGESMRHDGPVRSACFSPDGNRVATASADRTARVWDTLTGFPMSDQLRHEGEVIHVEFDCTGNRLVTTSSDETIRVWSIEVLPAEIPDWLPTLAEAVAGLKIDPQGVASRLPSHDILRIREEIMAKTETDPYAAFGRWFFRNHESSQPDVTPPAPSK